MIDNPGTAHAATVGYRAIFPRLGAPSIGARFSRVLIEQADSTEPPPLETKGATDAAKTQQLASSTYTDDARPRADYRPRQT